MCTFAVMAGIAGGLSSLVHVPSILKIVANICGFWRIEGEHFFGVGPFKDFGGLGMCLSETKKALVLKG